MKTVAQMTEELIKDAINGCKNKGYLKRLVRQYFEAMSIEERKMVYQELIKDKP